MTEAKRGEPTAQSVMDLARGVVIPERVTSRLTGVAALVFGDEGVEHYLVRCRNSKIPSLVDRVGHGKNIIELLTERPYGPTAEVDVLPIVAALMRDEITLFAGFEERDLAYVLGLAALVTQREAGFAIDKTELGQHTYRRPGAKVVLHHYEKDALAQAQRVLAGIRQIYFPPLGR